MNLLSLIQISVGAILIHNFVLARFLGLCPFFGVSKKLSPAFGMGVAVIFVMTVASLFTWPINRYILIPLQAQYLQTIVFIIVIASAVQFVEIVLKKTTPLLYDALGIYLPLMTTNCVIMGLALINIGQNPYTGTPFSLLEAIVNAITSGIGFSLALLLMAGIREKLELITIPKPLQGLPIAFISGGLMAMAFLGFTGLNVIIHSGGN